MGAFTVARLPLPRSWPPSIPAPSDIIIPLGDIVNRGMDSKGVIDILIDLSKRCRLIPILGNHDEMLLKAKTSRSAFRHFLEFGGIQRSTRMETQGRLVSFQRSISNS